MKNIKKKLSVQIALSITLLAPINISAMSTNSQPQTQTEQPKPFGSGNFGNRSQSQTQAQQTGTLSGFGNRSQPQTTVPKFGSTSNQPTTGFNFGKTSQPQTIPSFGSTTPIQQQTTTTPFGSTSNQPTTGFNFGKTSQPQTPPSFESKTPIQQQQTSPQTSNTPLLQVYFNPQDQLKITSTLFDLLDNAKKQVHIAMYWITDNTVIEKIIAAKRRNVDVKIVIDESCPKIDNIIAQLLQNNIIPVIYPSKDIDTPGKMHHKFVQVDGTTVFTGSANFTNPVLNEKSQKFNFENVVVIHSTDIAKQYIDAFIDMKKKTFYFYVHIIASNNPNQLSNWINNLVPMLYQKEFLMKQSVEQLLNDYSSIEQSRINNFFGIQSIERREDNMTIPQKRLLNANGFSDQDLLDLSKKETSDLITKVKSGYWERATEKQRALLKSKGFSDQEILFLSKDEASDLISQILQRGQQYSW